MATGEPSPDLAPSGEFPLPDPESIALLQYTSGSTSAPRGVVLTHGNLMSNSELICRFFGHTTESRGMIWLPPYHDMGLIGGIIQPLYAGFPVTLMSPADFLRRPLRWLEEISRTRATSSGGPNFAYDLCVRKTTAAERARLDLSSWQVAFNGAEPISAATMERFAQAFAPSGFRREAFHPCYGLAEATLMVTGGLPWSGGDADSFDAAALASGEAVRAADMGSARRLVPCGHAPSGQQVAIVDPAIRTKRADGHIGEVWISGPSVAQSYWHRPAETRETFGARLADGGEGAFLRSGDLGFVRGGELFVTGRIKDLVIVRGRNHYPQDIEATAERSNPVLRPGCGAAFTVPDGDQERLVVVHEVTRQAEAIDVAEVARAVRGAVTTEHQVRVHTVVLLPPGGIPKTSSGKIQRGLCAAMFESSDLPELGRDTISADAETGPADRLARATLLAAPSGEREGLLLDYLRGLAASACGIDPDTVPADVPLLALGVDSLAVIGIQNSIEADLGAPVTVSELADAGSLADLAVRLSEQVGADKTSRCIEAPVSYGQRSLWFLHELEPYSAAHNIAVALRLRGHLDAAALERALGALVARHDSLRTTFTAHDGEPVRRIAGAAGAWLRETDASGLDDAQFAGRLGEAAREPFDLARGPLLRIHLYRRAAGETVVLLVAHHIITDFWSMTTLVRELECLYSARAGGPPASLPEPADRYGDFVAWQQQNLIGETGLRLRSYWQEELRGAGSRLRLPRRTAAGGASSGSAGTCRLRLDGSLAARLKERARSEGVTLSMLLLTAYQLLLHRYTGQDDLCVGMPAAGRGRPEFEQIIGYCMNPVVIRSQLGRDESVRDALRQARRRVIGALEHQDYPLHLLAGDRGEHALFQAMFVFNRPPVRGQGALALLMMGQAGYAHSFGDLTAEAVPVDQHAAAQDLELTMAEVSEELLGSFRYRTDVLDDATAGQMMRHFKAIVAGIADDAGQPVSALRMLDEDEVQDILTRWNATARDYALDASAAQLFERQAAATPDAAAVVWDAGRLSYRELNENANRIAHFLRARGIGAGARVGLYLDRSPEMIAALLGVLKAGSAYVPVDPAYPRERVTATFADADVSIVLSQTALTGRLPSEIEAVLLDHDWPAILAHPSENPDQVTAEDSPAYVIYTSGSTGTPKGVVVEHHSLTNYTLFAAEHFGLSAGTGSSSSPRRASMPAPRRSTRPWPAARRWCCATTGCSARPRRSWRHALTGT